MRGGHVQLLNCLAVQPIRHFLKRRNVAVRSLQDDLFGGLGQIGPALSVTLDHTLGRNTQRIAYEFVGFPPAVVVDWRGHWISVPKLLKDYCASVEQMENAARAVRHFVARLNPVLRPVDQILRPIADNDAVNPDLAAGCRDLDIHETRAFEPLG